MNTCTFVSNVVSSIYVKQFKYQLDNNKAYLCCFNNVIYEITETESNVNNIKHIYIATR